MAPEVYRGDGYGLPADVWSLGIVALGWGTAHPSSESVPNTSRGRRVTPRLSTQSPSLFFVYTGLSATKKTTKNFPINLPKTTKYLHCQNLSFRSLYVERFPPCINKAPLSIYRKVQAQDCNLYLPTKKNHGEHQLRLRISRNYFFVVGRVT